MENLTGLGASTRAKILNKIWGFKPLFLSPAPSDFTTPILKAISLMCMCLSETLPTTKMAQTNPMPGSMGPWKITIYDQENFQGKRMEFTSSCPNVSERSFDNVRSLKVECGA